MFQLSILIPASDRPDLLEETLLSVLENRPFDCEVVLIHDGSYNDPYGLADELTIAQAPQTAGPTGLLDTLNVGIQACRGELIHVITPGILASRDWCQPALEQFADNRNVAALAPTIQHGRQIVCGVAFDSCRGVRQVTHRPTELPLMPTRLAGFYRASALRFMRGFDRQFAELSEVELGMRLRSANYETGRDEACSLRSVERLPQVDISRGMPAATRRAQLNHLYQRTEGGKPIGPWHAMFAELCLHRFRPVGWLAAMARTRRQPADQSPMADSNLVGAESRQNVPDRVATRGRASRRRSAA